MPNTVKQHFFQQLYRGPNEVESPTSSNHRSPHWTTVHNPSKIHDSFILASTAISFTLINQILYTIWQKLSHQSPTPLQRIALDHVFNALRLIVAALFKSTWLKITKTNPLTYGCRRHQRSIPLFRTSHTLLPRISNITPKHLNFAMYATILGIACYISNAVRGLTHK